jgi:hypothetical protein
VALVVDQLTMDRVLVAVAALAAYWQQQITLFQLILPIQLL